MDDESSMSSKSECIKALESLDLRQWLSHHNKNISKRYEHHQQSEKQRKDLLLGLQSERNPEKALGTILEFAFPRAIKKNGKTVNNALSSSACSKAIQNMLHDSSLHERYVSGVNAVTLLTEQRRKIVLNALTDQGYVNEEKQVSENKLKDYIESKGSTVLDDGRGFTPKLTPIPTPQHSKHRHHHHHHHHASHSHEPPHDPDEPLRRFEPKWDHYDTMRARWGYIRPQIKKLVQEQQVVAPRKSQKYVQVDKELVIHGNVNDIDHYHSCKVKKLAKLSNVSSKSQKLEADRIEEASKYYIPSPCVRY